MSSFNKFETHPSPIMDAIAYYLFESENISNVCRVLYDVNTFWRKIAIEYGCKEINLTLSGDNGLCGWKLEYLPSNIKIDKSICYCFVKEVWIKLDSSYLEDKEALQKLAKFWPSNIFFSTARRVLIYLDDGFGDYIATSESEGTIFLDIAKCVIRSMPKLQEARIWNEARIIDPYKANNCLSGGCCFDKLFSAILPKVKRLDIDLDCVKLPKSPSCLKNNTGLTSINYGSHNYFDVLQQLVERSALTLKSLSVYEFTVNAVVYILYNSKGGTIIYPQLEKLVLCSHNTEDDFPALESLESVIPFPILKYLYMDALYLFADDAPFRGNSGSLKYLELGCDDEFLRIAQKYEIFQHGQYQNLQCISLNFIRTDGRTNEDNELLLQFGLGLASPATQTFEFTNVSGNAIFKNLPEYPYMANLQILKMNFVKITLSNIITLLKLFPNLIEITCDIDGLGAELDAINYGNLPAELYSRNYPLNRFFKRLTICKFTYPYSVYAISAILLAIICPRFTLLTIKGHYLDKYYEELASTISTSPFSDYADRVKHLLKK
ncbi:hypothetical protein BX070DRAFT_220884 [Coemansia spiralis]|nr:hypothetical protein BX070DRAFT_220884 [Coemansia spiralis]